jgi:hypothetical protein
MRPLYRKNWSNTRDIRYSVANSKQAVYYLTTMQFARKYKGGLNLINGFRDYPQDLWLPR